MKETLAVIVVGLCIFACQIASGSIWYVDAGVPSSGDGTSWETAFKKIQEGIDVAWDGDTVTVAAGTYVENINFKGMNITLTSTDPTNPDVVASTIIDGNQAGAVVTFDGTEDESCVLSGFTIRNGKGQFIGGICGGAEDNRTHASIRNNVITGNSTQSAGGGGGGIAFCDGTIENNVISSNSAGYGGGGMNDCDGSIYGNTISGNSTPNFGGGLRACDGTIRDNVITENVAGSGGGLDNCQGTIEGNTISRNSADEGGGLYNCAGTIDNNTITRNSARASGGGLAACNGTIQSNIITANTASLGDGGGLNDCDGVIQDNTITGNSAGDRGGGLIWCNGTVANNTISNNSAGTDAGAMYGCFALIQGNVIKGNHADQNGGGLYQCGRVTLNNAITENSATVAGGGLYQCYGIIQNNTIARNSAQSGGGLYDCPATIRNCIIWQNSAAKAPQLYKGNEPSYSCIQGWTGGGEGNTADNPGFVNPKVGDYHLEEDSPCIDKGVNYYWFVPYECDLNGNCRLTGERVDMGCYEHGSSPDSDGDLLSDEDESAAGTDPESADSDADGLRDGLEILRGTGPLDPTPASVIHVPADMATIQQSLCLSVPGEEIVVAPGTYPENIVFSGVDLTLRGAGSGGPYVMGSTIIDGSARGSVVHFEGSETEVCVLEGFIIRNGRAARGGGIWGRWGLNPTHATIRNNLITANSADVGGGLNYCDGPIVNNTVARNSAAGEYGVGGGLYACSQVQGVIRNCIIWGNTAPDGPDIKESGLPSYSWVGGADPGFLDADGPDNDPKTYQDNDYRLADDSPCVDAGINEDWMWDAVDPDGNPRIIDGDDDGVRVVDMGAYEYRFVLRVLEATRTAEGGVELIWNSRPADSYIISICPDLGTWLWIPVATVPSQGLSTTWTDPDITLTRKMFYRISID